MTDKFDYNATGLDSPATDAAAITPSDTTDLTNTTRAIYVGTGGDLKVKMRGGQTVTFKAVPQGSTLPLRVLRVLSTGTTAADLVGLW
ncbi:MAG TPA: hypothetical protein VFW82_06715 [Dyella sp.]|nr:hypothetical protein [Dyella sp.]